MEKIAVGVNEACELTGIGRNAFRALLTPSSGLPYFKVGRNYKIPIEPLKKWLAEQASLKTTFEKSEYLSGATLRRRGRPRKVR